MGVYDRSEGEKFRYRYRVFDGIVQRPVYEHSSLPSTGVRGGGNRRRPPNLPLERIEDEGLLFSSLDLFRRDAPLFKL